MNKTVATNLSIVLLALFLASCGGGGGDTTHASALAEGASPSSPTSAEASPIISAPSAPIAPPLPSNANAPEFSAQIIAVPPDGSLVSGLLHLEVRGNGIENVELLPADSYTPIYGRFVVSSDKRVATLDFDTSKVSDGPLTVRVSAFDVPPATPGARDIVAMAPRTWQVRNSTSPSPPSLVDNVVPIYLDAGPKGLAYNRPYVDVTICRPGTQICQLIDHVLLDTGSTCLRVQNVTSALSLPVKKDGAGRTIAECVQFSGGAIYEWGSVRSADVRIGGKLAANVPITLLGTPPLPLPLRVPTVAETSVRKPL